MRRNETPSIQRHKMKYSILDSLLKEFNVLLNFRSLRREHRDYWPIVEMELSGREQNQI